MNKNMNIAIASLCTLALSISSVGIANAAESESKALLNSASKQVENTQSAVDAVAKDLEILFTRYIPVDNGRYAVNTMAVIADGYGDKLSIFQSVADAFNGEVSKDGNGNLSSGVSTRDAGSYAECVIFGALGIPVDAFGYGTWTAIVTAIKAWNWGLVASTIVRALGPAFLTGSGKALGGPALVAAALATAATMCAFSEL
ncbi:hypothetical protein HHJ78_06490 [Mobiluncus mulieris]|uniref:Uncharacterized protein n=1 Tax=Mobiluncus mulieris TaxID=2052 RepID=A0A7Y0U1E1_9ACTO|nr:hypothetical protein [Mobiluncus mulieris]NMW65185.1 hypothetical protein [Mobiluncus mulieris]